MLRSCVSCADKCPPRILFRLRTLLFHCLFGLHNLRRKVAILLRNGIACLAQLGLALKHPRKTELRAGG